MVGRRRLPRRSVPRYLRAEPAQIARRWRLFLRMRENPDTGGYPGPVLFFSGLFLSDHGTALPGKDLAVVRETLRRIHPEAFAVHMEKLEDWGPPAAAPGRFHPAW